MRPMLILICCTVDPDVKPQNILLHVEPGKAPQLFLTDFSEAQGEVDAETRLTDVRGTRPYMAPEFFGTTMYGTHQRWSSKAGEPTYTRSVDLWSAGATVYHALFGMYCQ